MSHPAARRGVQQRKADTLEKLQASGADVWVASASGSEGGVPLPHLVPLSLAWIDERVVVALPSDSQTARNIVQHRRTRLGLGPTRDVVMIDAVLDRAVEVSDVRPDFADRYLEQAGWDPREESGGYSYLVLRPERIQAWREANELVGRTLMRGGSWLV